jgi:hypothetical protein
VQALFVVITSSSVLDEPHFPVQFLADIEDRLFPILDLDVWERCLYYHLLRHTRLLGVSSVSFGLVTIARASGMSEVKAREALRNMDKKGCIQIEDRNRKGHVVRVLLPTEIERLKTEAVVEPPVDLDAIDFYADREYLSAILRRDADECFYCGRSVSRETVALDHVIADADGGSGSHRNIVAACHECNSMKQSTPASEHLRHLYRKGILSQADLATRLERLTRLQDGQLEIVLAQSK